MIEFIKELDEGGVYSISIKGVKEDTLIGVFVNERAMDIVYGALLYAYSDEIGGSNDTSKEVETGSTETYTAQTFAAYSAAQENTSACKEIEGNIVKLSPSKHGGLYIVPNR